MKKFFLFLALFFISFQANSSDLITTTFDGKVFDLAAQKNKVVIINFWAKWCVDCRKEMPILDELYKKYHARGLEIIGISIDHKKQREVVKKLSEQFSYPNSMIADSTKISFEEPDEIPLNYVINKKGELVKILKNGYESLTLKDFEEVIKPLF